MFTNLVANKNYQFQIRGLCGTVYSGNVIGTFKTKQNLKDDELQNRIANKEDSDNSSGPTTINLIPNPARDYTSLLIQGFEKQSKEVTMFDFNGKLVFKITVDAKDNQLELDLKTLSVNTGIYLIRVSDSQKQKTEQLMIER
ncbi:MAG: T9SS type A sorting domain-containing protein [Saprospiraceae bacterium]|nr:T9SS type A sorting domain-containing protein [Saprospiraceae bacterium]